MNQIRSTSKKALVSWQNIQGNKYSKSLHPAMLFKDGYRTTQKAVLIGNPKGYSEFVVVVYDMNYVITWLERKLIKPLENCSLEEIQDLVEQAYKKAKKKGVHQFSVIEEKYEEQV